MQCEYVNPREWNHGLRYEVKACSHRAIYWVTYVPKGYTSIAIAHVRMNVCTRHKNTFVHNQDALRLFRYGLLKSEETAHD